VPRSDRRVDPETGQVEVLRYVHCARQPARRSTSSSSKAQMHGGYAHGLGYALYEAATYDADGSFRTASFLDYTIVSAGEVAAEPVLVHIETPTDANPERLQGAAKAEPSRCPPRSRTLSRTRCANEKPDAVVDRLPITSDRIVEILAPDAVY